MHDDGMAPAPYGARWPAAAARRVAGLALWAATTATTAILAGLPGPGMAAPAAGAAPDLQAGAALAAQRNCLGCHHAVQRRAGPTFKAIAQRYNAIPDPKAREAALGILARKVREGGRGAWGVVPMPANRQVTEAESRQLVAWILEAHR